MLSRYSYCRGIYLTIPSYITDQQQQQQQYGVEMEGPATTGRGDAADPKSQNSVPTDQAAGGEDTHSRERRHSMGPVRRGSDRGGPGLRKSRSTQSMILRRTGSTATTSRPYDWRTTRSAALLLVLLLLLSYYSSSHREYWFCSGFLSSQNLLVFYTYKHFRALCR